MRTRSPFSSLNLAFACSSVQTENSLRDACEWVFNWIMFQKALRTETILVTDIDDTLVDRSQNSLPDVVALIKRVANNGVKVYFVTARMYTADFEKRTLKNLTDVGIGSDIVQDRLYMMPPELYRLGDPMVVAEYKRSIRRSLASKRFLCANLGDQMTDFMTSRHCIPTEHVQMMQHWPHPLVFVDPVEKTACLKVPRPAPRR
tara:strand:- start:642 stop:1250 length:609 start_codon:yes stop_codon:yes gene_type:complete